LTSIANCGACGNVCTSGVCLSGVCPGCPSGQHYCFGGCTDISIDSNNCGGCGHVCSLYQASSSCSNGQCLVSSCNPHYGDCNSQPSDGCETNLLSDLTHCGSCANSCSLLPHVSGTSCVAGVCTIISCASGWANLDGNVQNGCEYSLNNPCFPIYLGSVTGDTPSPALTKTGIGQAWYQVLLTEDDSGFSPVYLSATVTLTSPVGADYDLYVYCNQCGGSLAGASNSTGNTDVVNVRWDDTYFVNSSGYIIIEVRYKGGTSSNSWMLRVQGNTTVAASTCPSP